MIKIEKLNCLKKYRRISPHNRARKLKKKQWEKLVEAHQIQWLKTIIKTTNNTKRQKVLGLCLLSYYDEDDQGVKKNKVAQVVNKA